MARRMSGAEPASLSVADVIKRPAVVAPSQREMAAELASVVEALQASRARIVAVQEAVRRDIASHLHGRVQGRLLVLRGRMQQLAQRHTDPDTKAVLDDLIVDMDRLIVEEISRLSRRLYPAILRRGLVPALQSLADLFEDALAVELDIDDELMDREQANYGWIPETVRLAAYRVVEEALTNAVKYAQVGNVTIRLRLLSESWLHLRVEDAGIGFMLEKAPRGLGLAAMQDYAEAIGGRLTVLSVPSEGTEIRAMLPLPGLSAAPPAIGSA